MTNDTSPVANAKPSQAGASQQAWRQALLESKGTGAPGYKAVPTRVPTRSMRGRERNIVGKQYGEGRGEGTCRGVGAATAPLTMRTR